jgi:hypothetical protein
MLRGPIIGRQDRSVEMMKMARELASKGHRLQMIEAVLAANGYPEAADWLDQPHIIREFQDINDRARRREETS